MTRFLSGPAIGQTLSLHRAPLFLRVVRDGQGKWDALDKIDDEPAAGETIYAYRKASDDGACFVDGRDPKTGRRTGGCFQMASYAVVDPQPSDAQMRSKAAWQSWVAERATLELGRKVEINAEGYENQ